MEKESLCGLHNLEELYLDDNEMEEINDNLLKDVPQLKILDLYNNLSPKITPWKIRHLTKLKHLWVSGSSIDEEMKNFALIRNFELLTRD